MSEKDKSVEENSLDEELSLNGSEEDSDVSDDSEDEVELCNCTLFTRLRPLLLADSNARTSSKGLG